MSTLRRCPRCGALPKMAHVNIDRGTHAWAVHCAALCGADTHWQSSATQAVTMWNDGRVNNERGGQGDPAADARSQQH